MSALLKELRVIAAKLADAEEYVMVHHPAFRVGKKPFVIAGEEDATVTINWGPEAQADFLADKRFSRTHYIGRHGWVTVEHKRLKKGELAMLVTRSWERVAKKKPAKKKATAR